jgi:hypothetical protein
MKREAGKAFPCLDESILFRHSFFLYEIVKELGIRYIVLGGFFSVLVEDFRNSHPTQLFERRLQAILIHDRIAASSAN